MVQLLGVINKCRWVVDMMLMVVGHVPDDNETSQIIPLLITAIQRIADRQRGIRSLDVIIFFEDSCLM